MTRNRIPGSAYRVKSKSPEKNKVNQKNMADKSEKVKPKCNVDWRNYIFEGDRIQAHDGKGWYAATVESVNNKETDDLFIHYDNYSYQYDFYCSRWSKRIRPTIGFLRKKIMVPQAEKILSLRQENDKLKQQLLDKKEENKKLSNEMVLLENKYDEQKFTYLALAKRTSFEDDINNKDNDENSEKNDGIKEMKRLSELISLNMETLKEWNLVTKELDNASKDLNNLMRDENVDNPATIGDLVTVQTKIESLIELQQQRLETSHSDIIMSVMNEKFEIDEEIQKYSKELSDLRNEHSDSLEKFQVINDDCSQLTNSLHDLLRYCNLKIVDRNDLSEKQKDIQMETLTLEKKINDFNDCTNSLFSLLKECGRFQKQSLFQIDELSSNIQLGWDYIEQSWWKWQSNDIISWIRYKMNWMNSNAIPKGLDLAVILKKFKEGEVRGHSLRSITQMSLLNLGFVIYAHRANIYGHIKSMTAKYPLKECDNNNNDDNADGNNDGNDEGRMDGSTSDDNKHPLKYVCSLTNELMSEPVICGHNNKFYEKKAIMEYLVKHQRLPFETKSMEETKIEIDNKDESSFLLFDHIALKIEIDQYRKQYITKYTA